jgi:hypothetical protein
LKKGIQVFGDKGVEAVISELKHLHDRHVIEPIYPSDITITEQKRALPCTMFLKRKDQEKFKDVGVLMEEINVLILQRKRQVHLCVG